jgi:transcriptional regulator with XRE-family HTH domain
MDLRTRVASAVRAELGRAQVPRYDAAGALGISRQSLWRKLKGDHPFTLEEIATLADLIGVPMSALLPVEEGQAA